MNNAVRTIVFLMIGMLALPALGQDTDIRESVVKIFSTTRPPDPTRPWTKGSRRDVSGSGVVISNNRILTNAHVVRYAREVFVQPNNSSDKLPASIVAIAPGIDLAILKLEDESFFDTHPAALFSSDLPEVGQSLSAFGYPIGGDAMSITEGIVSRIEYSGYYQGTLGLRIQIDAPINPGNSGGPAFADDKVIGLVFSGIPDAQNIGYLIPVQEIRAFLDDIEDGNYQGRPRLFVPLQTLENPALRKKLGIESGMSGLVVTNTKNAESVFKKWDVVTAIGDKDIDNAGMISIEQNLRVDFRYMVPLLAHDNLVPITVWRNRELVEIQVPVSAQRDMLLKYLGNSYPSYFIYGPLVFTPVYADHLDWLGRALPLFIARDSPFIYRRYELLDEPGEQMVLLSSKLFSNRIAKGYDPGPFPILQSVNGHDITSLEQLVRLLRALEDEFVIFEWADRGVETLVFERDQIERATEEILEDNGVRSQFSDDLKDAWNNPQ